MQRRVPLIAGILLAPPLLALAGSAPVAGSAAPAAPAFPAWPADVPWTQPHGQPVFSTAGTAPEPGMRSPHALVRHHPALADPHAGPTVLRDVLEALGRPPQGPGIAAAAPSGFLRVGIASGRFGADGLHDALIAVDDVAGDGSRLDAVDGASGAALWSHDLSGLAWFLLDVADRTGDGRDDVLLWKSDLLGVETTDACAPLAPEQGRLCVSRVQTTYRRSVVLLSGADGTEVWRVDHDGAYRSGGASGGGPAVAAVGAGAGGFAATAYLVVPLAVADNDGDGRPDVIIHVYDYAGLGASANAAAGGVSAAVFEGRTLVTSKVTVVSGADGSVLHERVGPLLDGLALLLPAGDATLDGVEDLLWASWSTVSTPVVCASVPSVGGCLVDYVDFLSLEMVDGSTFETAWREESADLDRAGFLVAPLATDADGDGRSDVLLVEAPKGVAILRHSIRSGFDGSQVWQRDLDRLVHLLPLGPAQEGGDGTVFVLWRAQLLALEPLTVDVSSERLDGATGATLSTTHQLFAHDFDGMIIFAGTGDDADADGAREIVMNAWHFDFPGGVFDIESTARVESGRAGALLWDRFTSETASALVVADLDGDGAHDVLDLLVPGPPDLPDGLGLAAYALPGGAPLGALTDALVPPFGGAVAVTGDLNGSGGDGLLYTRVEVHGLDPLLSRVSAVDFDLTPACAWSVGEPLGTFC